MKGIRRFEAAGDLLRDIELFVEAVDVYISGGCWDKARSLADERCRDKRYVPLLHFTFTFVFI